MTPEQAHNRALKAGLANRERLRRLGQPGSRPSGPRVGYCVICGTIGAPMAGAEVCCECRYEQDRGINHDD